MESRRCASVYVPVRAAGVLSRSIHQLVLRSYNKDRAARRCFFSSNFGCDAKPRVWAVFRLGESAISYPKNDFWRKKKSAISDEQSYGLLLKHEEHKW